MECLLIPCLDTGDEFISLSGKRKTVSNTEIKGYRDKNKFTHNASVELHRECLESYLTRSKPPNEKK